MMKIQTLLFLLFTSLVARVNYATAENKNILFISSDDLASTLGCMGDPMAKTPHLDRLAAEGVCFLNAYNQIPLCNPSRASVMTGMRPDKIKVYDLDRHFRDELPNVVTLPQQFKEHGWFTARVGKIYHYNVPASIGTNGFDDPPSWQLTVNPKGRDKAEEHLFVPAGPRRGAGSALDWLAAKGTDGEQTDGMVTTETIRLMKENREKPFFLAAGFFRPHKPFVAPKKYFDLYPIDEIRLPYAPENDRDDIPAAAFAHNNAEPHYGEDIETLRKVIQAYYASVSFVDAQVGRLLDALDELGLADNTLVVFWSDHGYHLGEHNGIWQKRTLFEESAIAPLLIRVPKAKGNAQPCRRIVELIDIYPTLLEWAGLPSPCNLDGRSLLPLLHNPNQEWNGKAVTQILRPADHRLNQQVMGCSLRTARWRYTEWAEGQAGLELYDHLNDPMEFYNLAAKPDENAKKVMARLRKELKERASGKVPTTPVNPKRL